MWLNFCVTQRRSHVRSVPQLETTDVRLNLYLRHRYRNENRAWYIGLNVCGGLNTSASTLKRKKKKKKKKPCTRVYCLRWWDGSTSRETRRSAFSGRCQRSFWTYHSLLLGCGIGSLVECLPWWSLQVVSVLLSHVEFVVQIFMI